MARAAGGCGCVGFAKVDLASRASYEGTTQKTASIYVVDDRDFLTNGHEVSCVHVISLLQ